MTDNGKCIVVEDGPDSLGRYRYSMFWQTDYIPGLPEGRTYWRSQVFFATLPPGVPVVPEPPAGWGKLDKHGNIIGR